MTGIKIKFNNNTGEGELTAKEKEKFLEAFRYDKVTALDFLKDAMVEIQSLYDEIHNQTFGEK